MKNTSRRDFIKLMGLSSLVLTVPNCFKSKESQQYKLPNFIIIFTDDLGYGDLSSYGSPLIRTPCIDRMAREGLKFTSFYAQAVCGPSRASIMTGCYPIRIGEPGNIKNQHTVLHPDEVTIGEILQSRGYVTACLGKWHLAGYGEGEKPGDGPFKPELMPNAQGFDYFYGTPLFNGYTKYNEQTGFRCLLMRNDEVVDKDAEMDTLTQSYTTEAIRFVRENKDKPFFLYLAHNMPHVPLGASENYRGKSKRGLYGDVIEEIDWSTGQILDSLKELGIENNTFVVFTSDNGPWIEAVIGDHGGSAGPLSGAKMMTWDGGFRVPCIIRWPGKIPANSECNKIANTMDFLPTFAKLARAKLPDDRIFDGKDIWPLITEQKVAKSPHQAFYYYAYTHLQAVRSGNWKLVLPRPASPPWTGWSGRMIDQILAPQLFDLESDIAEYRNIADQYPEVVARLMTYIDQAREDLGDYDKIGKGARFFDPGPERPDMDSWKRNK